LHLLLVSTPTVLSTKIWNLLNDPVLRLSQQQIERYSPQCPGKPGTSTWPRPGYLRVPQGADKCPTIMHSYGSAVEAFDDPNTHEPLHGFFREAANGEFRFYDPREVAVAQGSPWVFTSPQTSSLNEHAWALLGSAIPPPMAAMGIALAAYMVDSPTTPSGRGRA
jgi:hypothetical protein